MADALFSGKVSETDLKRIRATAKRAPKELHDQFQTMFRTWGEEWHRLMVLQFRPAGSGGSRRLNNRTGRLRQSLAHRTTGGNLRELNMRAFSAAVPYAQIQEFGGTVRSSRPGGYLTIPLSANITGDGAGGLGTGRQPSARDMIRRKGLESKSAGGTMLFWRSEKGNLLLGERKANGDVVPLWILRKEITVPGPRNGKPSRLGFFRNWQRLGRRRAGQFDRAARRALRDATKGSG